MAKGACSSWMHLFSAKIFLIRIAIKVKSFYPYQTNHIKEYIEISFEHALAILKGAWKGRKNWTED